MIWVVLASVALLVAGFSLFFLGWRGRRVDDHPRCCACGFDVAGVSRTSGAVCPECGRPIDGRIRIGNRRRRPVWLALGVVLLFPVVLGGGAVGWSAATGFDWNTVKPVWWLMSDLRSFDVRRSSAAGDELAARGSADELTDDQLGELLDATLEVQADPSRGWSPALGDLVDQVFAKGKLDDAQYESFLSQSLVIDIRMNERVPRDKPTGLTAQFRIGRSGSATRVTGRFVLTGTNDVEGTPAPELGLSLTGGFQITPGGSSGSSMAAKALETLEVGVHELRFDLKLWLPQTGGGNGPPEKPAETRVFLVPIELLPIGTRIVDVIDNPSLESDIRSWLTTIELSWVGGSDVAPTLQYSIDFAGERTVPLAFLIEAEIDGERFGGSTLAIPQGTSQSGYGGGLSGASRPAESVTLILTGDEDAAIAAGFTEYWGGTLRFEGIPMGNSDAVLPDGPEIAPGETGGAHPEPEEN